MRDPFHEVHEAYRRPTRAGPNADLMDAAMAETDGTSDPDSMACMEQKPLPQPRAPANAASASSTPTLSTGASSVLLPQRFGVLGRKPPRTTRELSLYNYRLGFFNLVANWANMRKTKYLEGVVQRGKEQLEELNAKVAEQDGELDELATGVEQVVSDMKAQKAQMGSALERFGEQVLQQNEKILMQQEAMERMMESKFQRDAAIDTSIAAVSGWLSTTPIISLPVYLLTMWLPRKPRWLASTLLRLAAFFRIATSLRRLAVDHNVHNAVGTPSTYIAAAINYVRQKTNEKMREKRKLKEKGPVPVCPGPGAGL